MTRKSRVRRVNQRQRAERVNEELKGESGLDHFEKLTFAHRQHGVSRVLARCASLVAEHARAFPLRPDGRVSTTRSRHERHFGDSIVTFRLGSTIAGALTPEITTLPTPQPIALASESAAAE